MRLLFLTSLISISTAFPGYTSHIRKETASSNDSEFPYTGAKQDGLPGSQRGGVLVPAIGDTEHEFRPPTSTDIRGPCPGMNTLANHGFISRDGITNFVEMVAALQNVFNTAYDVAVILAVVGIVTDGDVITEKLSIGGDATSRTAPLAGSGGLLGPEKGLDNHNIFECDASVSRNDYYLADGDNYTFNVTLFEMMTETVASTSSASDPLFTVEGLSLFRLQRWKQSQSENEKFFFGPIGIHLYGATSFLYTLFPSQANNLKPDLATTASFFGAIVPDGITSSTYGSQPERIPPNWTNRQEPFTLIELFEEILSMYLLNPVLIGGNVGPGNFDAIGTLGGGIIKDGRIGGESGNVTATDLACFMYQLIATTAIPTSVSDVVTLPIDVVNWALGKLNPVFEPLGCPLTQV